MFRSGTGRILAVPWLDHLTTLMDAWRLHRADRHSPVTSHWSPLATARASESQAPAQLCTSRCQLLFLRHSQPRPHSHSDRTYTELNNVPALMVL